MKLILASQEIDLMILATKFQKLMKAKGEEIEVLFLRRKKMDYDDFYILDYPDKIGHAIELLTPDKKKENISPFNKEIVANMKPLRFDEFENLNIDTSFEKYISNFYNNLSGNTQNTYGVTSIRKFQFQKEYNSSDFIGKLCARLYFDYENERTNLFQNTHRSLIASNKLLFETLKTSIAYVFPPETDFIASIEASWEPPLSYD